MRQQYTLEIASLCIVSAFFLFNGYLQVVVDRSGRTQSWTVLVGSIGEPAGFGLGLALLAGLLRMARTR